MLCMLIRIISAITLATLLAISSSYAQQQYRQPTQQEIAGARTLKEQATSALQLPSSASWNQIYLAFFNQSRAAICSEFKNKGLKGSCDWDTIMIILIATNDPEIKTQSSTDTIMALTAMKIVQIKSTLATGCPLLNIQSSWDNLLICGIHQEDTTRRKQLNFAPGTPVEMVDYVWKREKVSSRDKPAASPLPLPLRKPTM